jgi:D-3-phosphoglycerate dehydrogenase / 2-oxoglutarate reductase
LGYKVVITDCLMPDTGIERAILAEIGAEVIRAACKTPQDVIDVARDADALMVQRAPINAEVIGHLDRCRIISRYGIGLDGIDVAAATARGIAVVANSDYCIREVAEHALALLLACARRLGPAMAAARAGNWNKRSFMKPLVNLSGQTLGIVGFGRIGRQLAELAAPLVARIVVFDPFVTASPHADILTFDELLSVADFISLHCPLTGGTKDLFGEQVFRKMKPTAWLINVARGQIVNEAALLKALEDGAIAGAALDVFVTEPLDTGHPLLALPNVIATPHVAWYSERAYHLLQENTARAVMDYLRT